MVRISQFKIQLKYILIITLLCGLSFLCYSITIQIRQKKIIERKIQTLPQFSFQEILGNNFNSSYINSDKSCLIIYFHPECDHCHYEAEQICLNIDRFYNFQIVMISPASRESIENFANNYHLLEFDNITILIDSLDGFHDIFGHNPFPTSFIYNKERKLVKQFKGEVTTEALLNYLNQ
ncbi:Thiol-disulfide oxidoreductase ResA [subsurface metagenome]